MPAGTVAPPLSSYLSLRLDPVLARRLRMEADARGTTPSQLARHILARALDRQPAARPEDWGGIVECPRALQTGCRAAVQVARRERRIIGVRNLDGSLHRCPGEVS